MAVWDAATPAGSDPANQIDDRIRELKVAINDALLAGEASGAEALFPGPNPTTDPIYRPRMGKGAEASRPAAAVGGLYYNETTGTIQRSNGSAWVDLTENAAYEAIHQKAGASLASVAGVATLPETGNSFNVSGTEAMASLSGWSAGVVIIKWTQARTLTHGASFYLMEALSRAVSANDISVFEFTGSNAVREVAFHGAKLLPTRQTFLSGSGTYATPAGARQLRIRMVGAGGGGGGQGATISSAAAAGGNSSFNSIVAVGGGAGPDSSNVRTGGGAGGTGGTGTASLRIKGGGGGGGEAGTSNGTAGGNTAFGGGAAGVSYAANGIAGAANSGGGGGGATAAAYTGGGGGGGEYAEIIISNPSATYTYAVGAGGAGGIGANQTGGAGGSGIVIVDESY